MKISEAKATKVGTNCEPGQKFKNRILFNSTFLISLNAKIATFFLFLQRRRGGKGGWEYYSVSPQ